MLLMQNLWKLLEVLIKLPTTRRGCTSKLHFVKPSRFGVPKKGKTNRGRFPKGINIS